MNYVMELSPNMLGVAFIVCSIVLSAIINYGRLYKWKFTHWIEVSLGVFVSVMCILLAIQGMDNFLLTLIQ